MNTDLTGGNGENGDEVLEEATDRSNLKGMLCQALVDQSLLTSAPTMNFLRTKLESRYLVSYQFQIRVSFRDCLRIFSLCGKLPVALKLSWHSYVISGVVGDSLERLA